MKNTTFVSAGAGSGKTHLLTQNIADMITKGKCRAEEIILTTFTDAAALELREKVRLTLYSQGLYEAAINIDNAAIGTIHSIAYQFVSRYWYLLGISANSSIMDTEGSKFCISQSLSSLPTDVDLKLFDTICRSFNITLGDTAKLDFGFWKNELKSIIDKTVELCIDAKRLEEARDESTKLLKEVVKWSGNDLTGEEVNTVLTYANESLQLSGNKDTRAAIEKNIRLVKSGKDVYINLYGIYRLANIIRKDANTKKKAPHIAYFFEDMYSSLPSSVQGKNLIESYINTIFRLAIQWKKEYEEFKRKHCLLDYGDLLLKFDELLGKKEVIADLQSRYKVAFVDEFQDCSPLQVKSFVRLSELMEQSVWVGDLKQAIYGFRGSNTELIKSIIDEVKLESDGNKSDSLEFCWRSNKTIINFVNNLFCDRVFNGQIERKFIELKFPERKDAPKERDLQHMHFVCGRKEDIPEALAEKIESLISEGTFKASDIAVLYRDKYGVQNCAKALKERGIAFNARWESDSTEESANDAISTFINAVISFAARGDNELSKAIITNRIEEGCSLSELLTDRLQYVEANGKDSDWLADKNIISRIADLRNTIGNQSVSAAVETLVVELNLVDLIKRIDPNAPTYNYCSALEAKAVTYEGICANFGLSSTLMGFVEYLKSHPVEYPGDDKGVAVMTYHKSKGLQWPCVILCSVNKAPVDPKKLYFGVQTSCTATDTLLRLIPGAIKDCCGGMMDRFADNDFFRSLERATINEAKRLMYVGMTRAKEQLILTTYGSRGVCDWLNSIGCDALDYKSDASVINWGGADWRHSVTEYVLPEQEESTAEAVEYQVLKQPAERSSFEAKFVSPSKVKEAKQQYEIKRCDTFAKRISAISRDGSDSTIGNFIHHTLCLWNGDKSIIGRLAEAYGVRVDVEEVASSIDKFRGWMKETYGEASQIERELPFSFTNELGQVVTGEIDLVYRTDKGDVLVDYKTYQGKSSLLTDEESNFYAGKYCGQLALYEEALKRNGRVVRDRLICYFALGEVVKMG